MVNTRNNVQIFIYSKDWIHASALKHLFCGKRTDAEFDIMIMESIATLCMPHFQKPYVIIIDVQPSRYVSLIFTLRKNFPDTFLICTQRFFLYSDRMVSEYFGGIFLKEYEALMSGYPEVGIADHIASQLFSGAYPPLRHFDDDNAEDIMNSLNKWLRKRLPELIRSSKAREINLDWLARGVSLRDTAKHLRKSDKLVYHYRWLMMKALGINHYSRDYIQSLTVKAWPNGYDNNDFK